MKQPSEIARPEFELRYYRSVVNYADMIIRMYNIHVYNQ